MDCSRWRYCVDHWCQNCWVIRWMSCHLDSRASFWLSKLGSGTELSALPMRKCPGVSALTSSESSLSGSSGLELSSPSIWVSSVTEASKVRRVSPMVLRKWILLISPRLLTCLPCVVQQVDWISIGPLRSQLICTELFFPVELVWIESSVPYLLQWNFFRSLSRGDRVFLVVRWTVCMPLEIHPITDHFEMNSWGWEAHKDTNPAFVCFGSTTFPWGNGDWPGVIDPSMSERWWWGNPGHG